MNYDQQNYCYAFLGLSILLCWALPNRTKPLALAMYLISTLVGILHNKLNLVGLAGLSFYFVLHMARHNGQVSKLKNWLIHFLIVIISLALFFHALPGFNNLKILNGIKFSERSTPYSMYLNFDTGSIAFFFSYFSLKNRGFFSNWKPITIVTIKSLAFCALILMGTGVSMSYIAWDPKIPVMAPVWLFSNLLFTCIAEELFFRSYIQNEIQKQTSAMKWPWHSAIGITSILFGMRHMNSGPIFVLLSAIAGFFYGYSFYKTNSVVASIFTHFFINVVHFFFFTYPSLA